MKFLWLDTETTGLDPEKNGLLQIACIVEIDGKVHPTHGEAVVFIRPFEDDEISEEALRVQGITMETLQENIKDYAQPANAQKQLKWYLERWIDKFDPDDKFTVAGYNPVFDVNFIEAFFRKLGDPYLYSYIRRPVIDILSVCRYLSWAGILNVENHKLETVCEAFDIELHAHTALDDIRATRELALKIKSLIGGNLT